MITEANFYESNKSISLNYIALYANTFLIIKSDYINDDLNYEITFSNKNNEKSYTMNAYADFNNEYISIYLKSILQIIQSDFYDISADYFTIDVQIKEYHNDEYIDENIIENIPVYFYNSYLYDQNIYYPNYDTYYFFYNGTASYDIISKRNCKWYWHNGSEILSESIVLQESMSNNKIIDIKDNDNNLIHQVKIFYIDTYDILNSLEFLNLSTGHIDRFSGWKIIDEKINTIKDSYKNNDYETFGYVETNIEQMNSLITIASMKIPSDMANYIYKNILLSPIIKFNDTDYILIDSSFDDLISDEEDYDFVEIKLQLKQ